MCFFGTERLRDWAGQKPLSTHFSRRTTLYLFLCSCASWMVRICYTRFSCLVSTKSLSACYVCGHMSVQGRALSIRVGTKANNQLLRVFSTVSFSIYQHTTLKFITTYHLELKLFKNKLINILRLILHVCT